MNISVIAFTEKGAGVADRITGYFQNKGDCCELFGKPQRPGLQAIESSLEEWCQVQFQKKDAIIFIGAAGIAVRGIASAVRDKFADPAVLVIDEAGQYVIPILSGHVGGGNALARQIAQNIGAEPVITTATDVSGVFAIDVFAKENGLLLEEKERAIYKKVSAALLRKEKLGIFIKPSISYTGKIPEELQLLDEAEWHAILKDEVKVRYPYVIAITDEILPKKDWLVPLVPQCHILGIGCKKDTPVESMREAFACFIKEQGITKDSVRALASIDLKQREPAIIALAVTLKEDRQLSKDNRQQDLFLVYTAEQLLSLKGEFTSSGFVQSITGVDNVCERAAVAGARKLWGQGQVQVKKTVYQGITFALAGIEEKTDWRIYFE